MAKQHWDLVRVAITRRLCRCGEIECPRCTLPWRPPEERTRRELIEDVVEADGHAEELRERIRDCERVLALMADRMELIRACADPKAHIGVDRDEIVINRDEEEKEGSCPE